MQNYQMRSNWFFLSIPCMVGYFQTQMRSNWFYKQFCLGKILVLSFKFWIKVKIVRFLLFLIVYSFPNLIDLTLELDFYSENLVRKTSLRQVFTFQVNWSINLATITIAVCYYNHDSFPACQTEPIMHFDICIRSYTTPILLEIGTQPSTLTAILSSYLSFLLASL